MGFEFKVGDKVRVRSNVKEPQHGWGSVAHGDIGVVNSVCGDSGEVLYCNFPHQSWWKGAVDEMELVERIYKKPVVPTEYQQIWDAIKGGEWGYRERAIVALVSAIIDHDLSQYLDSE